MTRVSSRTLRLDYSGRRRQGQANPVGIQRGGRSGPRVLDAGRNLLVGELAPQLTGISIPSDGPCRKALQCAYRLRRQVPLGEERVRQSAAAEQGQTTVPAVLTQQAERAVLRVTLTEHEQGLATPARRHCPACRRRSAAHHNAVA